MLFRSERGGLALRGNHDQAAVSGDDGRMNDYARASAGWTARALDDEARDFLASLPLTIEDGDCLFVHSDASDPAGWLYVSDEASAERSLFATQKRMSFCGHIHRPQIYHMTPRRPPQFFAPRTSVATPLIASRKWLCVLGAVGQPRDENPAAAWCLLDTDKGEVTYNRAGYDIERAAKKIHDAGLPQILAARLFIGR